MVYSPSGTACHVRCDTLRMGCKNVAAPQVDHSPYFNYRKPLKPQLKPIELLVTC